MAKATAKKKDEVVEEQPEVTNAETTDTTTTEETDVVETVEEQPEKEYVYVPDVPAQMVTETAEILFLRKILKIQHEGCFGRHLDTIINDRIKELKA